MKKLQLIAVLLGAICLSAFDENEPSLIHFLPYEIPEQEFDIFSEMGAKNLHDTIKVKSFLISPQIQYWEYKEYLRSVKKDSSEKFYRSQFPDSTMCLRAEYEIYLNSKDYDLFPVVGISWDNANNYLHWLTVKKNKDRIYDTIYRLPKISEWVAAYRYLKTTDGSVMNMNRDYSDWTSASYDESYYDLSSKRMRFYDYSFDAKPDDSPVLKRKRTMGNSAKYSQPNLYGFYSWYFYEFHGYSHISFRYVREVFSPEELERQKNLKWIKNSRIPKK